MAAGAFFRSPFEYPHDLCARQRIEMQIEADDRSRFCVELAVWPTWSIADCVRLATALRELTISPDILISQRLVHLYRA
jgi:hypothetical protein